MASINIRRQDADKHIDSNQCNCCPYGFHIELDFVQFAENISNGTYSIKDSTLKSKANDTYDHNRMNNAVEQLDLNLSNSFENIVSDFEEVLTHRGYLSDREFNMKTNDYTRGYLSDTNYPVMDTSSDRYCGEKTATTNKPVWNRLMKNNEYCTELGRAFSQIQQNNALDFYGSSCSETPYGFHRQNGNALANNSSLHSSSIYTFNSVVGNTKSRIIDYRKMSDQLQRLPLLLSDDNTALESISNSSYDPFQRSTSAMDVNGFLSVRRKKLQDFNEKPLSTQSSGNSKVQHVLNNYKLDNINELKNDLLKYKNFSMKNAQRRVNVNSSSSSHRNLRDFEKHWAISTNSANTDTLHERLFPSPGETVIEYTNYSGRSSTSLPTTNQCLDCFQLKQQFLITIERLKIAEKSLADRNELQHKEASVNTIHPILADKCIGGASIRFKETAMSTINDEFRDFSCNTESPDVVHIAIGTDYPDMVINGIFCESSTSLTYPFCYSIGTMTDKRSHTTTTDSLSNVVDSECSPIEQFAFQGTHTSTNTFDLLPVHDKSCATDELKAFVESSTMTEIAKYCSIYVQTDYAKPNPSNSISISKNCPAVVSISSSSQTDFFLGDSEPRVLDDEEVAQSIWLLPYKSMVDAAVSTYDAVYMYDFAEQGSGLADRHIIQCLESDEDLDNREERPRELGADRAEILKKLLTENRQKIPAFVRGTSASRSYRIPTNKGDNLQYIADQYRTEKVAMPSTPQTNKGALKEKVILKKELIAVPPSQLPEPVPARIPRPKYFKYSPADAVPQSPDEVVESMDRLTPLRSELRLLRPFQEKSYVQRNSFEVKATGGVCPNEATSDADSSSSSDSECSCNTHTADDDDDDDDHDFDEVIRLSIPSEFYDAIDIFNKHIVSKHIDDERKNDWAVKYVQHEWLKTSARKTASSANVQMVIDAIKDRSMALLKYIINIKDPNENTALHYAVSHGNLGVVNVILDTKVCDLNCMNGAGYTPVMLAALCDATDEMNLAVIQRIFEVGNVNMKANKHGQTALMLAASHGKFKTVELLLHCHADLNMQDEEGSTALMCAAEHGHNDIVKLMLNHSNIDASLADCVGV